MSDAQGALRSDRCLPLFPPQPLPPPAACRYRSPTCRCRIQPGQECHMCITCTCHYIYIYIYIHMLKACGLCIFTACGLQLPPPASTVPGNAGLQGTTNSLHRPFSAAAAMELRSAATVGISGPPLKRRASKLVQPPRGSVDCKMGGGGVLGLQFSPSF